MRKATGELNMFREIWEEREHRCWITGNVINEPSPQCFAHILGKGGYPKYRLNKDNILLMDPHIHHLQHSLGKSVLIERYPKFLEFFEQQDQMKSKYNELYLNQHNDFRQESTNGEDPIPGNKV